MRTTFRAIDRRIVALACSNAGGWFGGLASEGFFVAERNLALCFSVAIAAGAAGALIGAKGGREHVYPGELVLPSAVSLVPFALAQRDAQRREQAAKDAPDGDP